MTDLSTSEHNARVALVRDPKECVAITAEEACALFDRLRDLESEHDRAEIHAARAEEVAAAERKSAGTWKRLAEGVQGERDAAKNEVSRTRFEAAQEIELLKRDRDERLAACMRGEQHQRERICDLVALLAETEARMHAAEGEVAQLRQRIAQLEGARP